MGNRRADSLSTGPFRIQHGDVGESASLHALINILGISSADVAREVGLTRGRIAHFLHPHEHVPPQRRREFIEMLRGTIQVYGESYDNFESYNQDRKPARRWREDVLEMLPAFRAVLAACQTLADQDEALLQTELDGPGAGDAAG